jgi:thiamine biosynthesis protein ThiS
MKITLNNTLEVIERDSITIRELLQYKNYTFKMLVIRINGSLVPKDSYDRQSVMDGDDVMILHLVSGG